MNERSAFTVRLLTSMRTISLASKQAKRRQANCCSSRNKCSEELSGEGKTAEEIARSVDADPEDVFHLLRHLASNAPRIKVVAGRGSGG